MVKFLSFFLILFCVKSINAQSTTFEKQNAVEQLVDYPAKLIGGYRLIFKATGDDDYLYLANGAEIITELSSQSKGLPLKNLGYIGADFSRYFVFVQSFGSGNPHQIKLIKKATGKNILNSGSCWIGVLEKEGFLLYSENDVPTEKDKMILYNVSTGSKKYFPFPADIFGEPMILNRISIKTLTDKVLTIEYLADGAAKLKKYKL